MLYHLIAFAPLLWDISHVEGVFSWEEILALDDKIGNFEESMYVIHMANVVDQPLLSRIVVYGQQSLPAVLLNSTSVQAYLRPPELRHLLRTYRSHIQGVVRLSPLEKYNSATLSAVQRRQGSIAATTTLLVTLHNDQDTQQKFEHSCRAFCPTCILKYDESLFSSNEDPHRTVAIEIRTDEAESVLKSLAELSTVQWLEESLPYSTFNRWATDSIFSGVFLDDGTMDENWAENHTAEGEVIGVSDTGIDLNSCFFADEKNPVLYDIVDKKHRKIIYYGTKYGDSSDGPFGHGTHVVGSIAGESLTSSRASFNGVAQRAKIAFLDIENSQSGLLNVPYSLKYVFQPLYNAGARIFSNSWGSSGMGGSANMYTMNAREIDIFMNQYPDTLILFAAGNNGMYGPHSVATPSTNKNGICVGASLNKHDSFSKDGVAYFSSIGPTFDNRLKPDILAPGWFVQSVKAGDICGLTSMAGTSMATPIVAGAAAVVREYFFKGYYPSGGMVEKDRFIPSGALLKAILIHSGQPLDQRVYLDEPASQIPKYPSNEQGYGRIDINKVLRFRNFTEEHLSFFIRGGARKSDKHYVSVRYLGEEHRYTFKVASVAEPHPIRATLTYTDIASFPSQSSLLINEISMVLLCNETGEVFTRLNANWARDNVIVIDIVEPIPNTTLIVMVTADSLISEQSYALVLTGETQSVIKEDLNLRRAHFLQKNYISKILRQIVVIVFLSVFFVAGLVENRLSILKKGFRAFRSSEDESSTATGDVASSSEHHDTVAVKPVDNATQEI